MSVKSYTDSEAEQLQGKNVRMIAEGNYVPRGTRGRVNGKSIAQDGSFDIVVNWEVNPMLAAPVPIQAVYSKAEVTKLMHVLD
jgi:hypothetical protein